MLPSRQYNIDILRGIAALAVTYYHLAMFGGFNLGLQNSGKYGYLGVQIFFVISGFILPFSLHNKTYHITNFPKFLLKRILRLDPPYLISIVIGIILALVTTRPIISTPALLLHLGYLNAITGYQWLSPVYWTLAIEFQFILFLGICFYFIQSNSKIYFHSFAFILLGCSLLFPNQNLLPHYLPFFLIGIMAYRCLKLNTSNAEIIISFAIYYASSFYINGFLAATVALITALIILYWKPKFNLFTNLFIKLGTISYALYLIHSDLGKTCMAIFRHLPVVGEIQPLRLIFGLASSVALAAIYFKLVEKPALIWSNKIKFKTKKETT